MQVMKWIGAKAQAVADYVKGNSKRLNASVDRTVRGAALLLAGMLAVGSAGAQTSGPTDTWTSSFGTIATTVAAIGAAAVVIAVAWVTARVVINGIKHFGK